MTAIADLTAPELARAYRRGEISPVEAAADALARIDAAQPKVNAFVHLGHEAAMAAARASEARFREGRPLGDADGLPTTVKDLALARGWPTLRGSKTSNMAGPWDVDAPFVARIREAGCVLLGKTTTPEFGWKGVTDSPLSGVTRNPWDLSKTPGGSSGGAAAAAALNLGVLHQGTDGGGSIRIPAGFTGVFGLKPTYGQIATWPASPFGPLSHIGPMSRSVGETALMMNVIAHADPRDGAGVAESGRDWRIGLDDGVRGLRIAYSPRLGHVGNLDPRVEAATRAAVMAFEDLGAHVDEVDPPIEDPAWSFRVHWRTGAAYMLSLIPEAQQSLVDPDLRRAMADGATFSAVDFHAAVAQRARLATVMQLFHERYDLLVTPTLPITAFEAGRLTPADMDCEDWPDWTPYSFPFNLTAQPAASVPSGLVDGLPVGMQIVAARWRDDLVMRAARAFESARPWPFPAL